MHVANNRAFTLIELLVVVTILSILIAILIPSLAGARLQARKTAVLAQLHDIGLSMATYENEYNNARPTDLTSENRDGRAFPGLAIMTNLYNLPTKLLINGNTADTPATQFDTAGNPVLADLAGSPITATLPATIDSSNIGSVNFHCSFAYDHERKRTGDADRPRVYLADRADYKNGRSFSANWGPKGSPTAGMCALFTDQHAEFLKSQAIAEQADPNIYHHNEFGGEGADEVVNNVSVAPATLDTHLRFFSEEEDDALLPDN